MNILDVWCDVVSTTSERILRRDVRQYPDVEQYECLLV